MCMCSVAWALQISHHGQHNAFLELGDSALRVDVSAVIDMYLLTNHLQPIYMHPNSFVSHNKEVLGLC